MKIIDLLNKIANGEEVPKKIIYKNNTYQWIDRLKFYFRTTPMVEISLSREFSVFDNLNYKIEIIEEPKEKIKVIELFKRMADGKSIPSKIKLQCVNGITEDNCIYKFNPLIENYINEETILLSDATCFGTLLHLEVEIIK